MANSVFYGVTLVLLCVRQSAAFFSIAECGVGKAKLEVDERTVMTSQTMTCTGIDTPEIVWSNRLLNGTILRFASCNMSACSYANSAFGAEYLTAERMNQSTSVLRVPNTTGNLRLLDGLVQCEDGVNPTSPPATCDVTVVYTPDSVKNPVLLKNTNAGTLSGSFDVDTIFASDGVYSCSWVLHGTTNREIAGLLDLTLLNLPNGLELYKARCAFSTPLSPDDDSYTTYTVYIQPGGSWNFTVGSNEAITATTITTAPTQPPATTPPPPLTTTTTTTTSTTTTATTTAKTTTAATTTTAVAAATTTTTTTAAAAAAATTTTAPLSTTWTGPAKTSSTALDGSSSNPQNAAPATGDTVPVAALVGGIAAVVIVVLIVVIIIVVVRMRGCTACQGPASDRPAPIHLRLSQESLYDQIGNSSAFSMAELNRAAEQDDRKDDKDEDWGYATPNTPGDADHGYLSAVPSAASLNAVGKEECGYLTPTPTANPDPTPAAYGENVAPEFLAPPIPHLPTRSMNHGYLTPCPVTPGTTHNGF